jgi:hypothetical protein
MSNNKIGLKVFENNISFHGVDISDMIYDAKYNRILTNLVQYGIDHDEILPIHVDSVYPHDKLEEAIRYMGSGHHVGT